MPASGAAADAGGAVEPGGQLEPTDAARADAMDGPALMGQDKWLGGVPSPCGAWLSVRQIGGGVARPPPPHPP